LNIFDVEFQHALRVGEQHSVIWGGGYRRADDHVSNTAALAFLPADRNLSWGNLFAQDEIALRGDQLRLTLGTQAQSNPYTGTEFLPSARIAWKPDASRLVWSALSRAVRAPARLDRELFVPGQPPFFLAGGPDFQSEIAKVLELGYRAQPSRRASYSVTVFHSVYDHLRSHEPGPSGGAPVPACRGTRRWTRAMPGISSAASNWRSSLRTSSIAAMRSSPRRPRRPVKSSAACFSS